MPIETIYTLGESQITISGGGILDGETQGSGVHLNGLTITLNSNMWEPIDVFDSEGSFQDSDGSQTLSGDQTMDGTLYTGGSRVEAEYGITVEDPDGNSYQMIGFNINQSGSGLPSYGTVEGLAFVGGVGGFPPRGVPLTVTSTQEGPSYLYSALATPPCFLAGGQIVTPHGTRRIETLTPGDLVCTRDHGPQPLRWIGQTYLPHSVLLRKPEFQPVVIDAASLSSAPEAPTTWLSPQHRVLVSGWEAELYFGEAEVLVPASKLVNARTIRSIAPRAGVSYVHLLFDCHEIVNVDGIWSESLLLTQSNADRTPTHQEVAALFPELLEQGHEGQAARPVIEDRRATLIAA